MSTRTIHIGVVTDEVSRDLHEALGLARHWGLRHYELREGSEHRFPDFTPDEVRLVDEVVEEGGRITAVSPGLFKGAVDDEARLRHELDDKLPRSIEQAQRFDCPLIILFGFARYEGEPESNRALAQQAFAEAAEQAHAAGLTVAIENEPAFWIDRPAEAAALLGEVDHPALRLNWDPANLHWGGKRPTRADFEAVRPYLANLHVKDYYPQRPDAPWLPVGEGVTPWAEILPWIIDDTDLPHVTLETHCVPLVESSYRSLQALQDLLGEAAPTTIPSSPDQ